MTLKHSSYQQIIYKIDESKNNKITLSPLVNVLDEVLIGFDNEAEDIISKARKKFKDTYRKDPYWASSNLKQVLTRNDTLPAYLEGNYNLFMVGNDKDVWNLPILVPLETRRTKEKFIEVFGTKKQKKQTNFYESSGVAFAGDLFLNYRFSEFAHPFLKKGKRNYSFTLDDTIVIDGMEHYVISYKSIKENINIKGRIFNDVSGNIIIEKQTSTIKSLNSLYRRSLHKNSKGVFTIFNISYKKIDNIIYPKTIAYTFKWNTGNNMPLMVEGLLSLDKINTKPVENYRRTISPNSYLFHSSDIYNSYDANFWSNNVSKPNFLEVKYFGGKIKNEAFVEGANQEINPKELYPGTKESESKLLDLMPKSRK